MCPLACKGDAGHIFPKTYCAASTLLTGNATMLLTSLGMPAPGISTTGGFSSGSETGLRVSNLLQILGT